MAFEIIRWIVGYAVINRQRHKLTGRKSTNIDCTSRKRPNTRVHRNHALTSVSLVAFNWHVYISARRTFEVSENSDLRPVTLKQTGTHRYTNSCMKTPSRPHGTYADTPSGVQTHTAICSHTWICTDIIWIMTRRDM